MALSHREQQELSALAAQLTEEDPDLAGRLTADPTSTIVRSRLPRRWVLWFSAASLLPAVVGAVLTFAAGRPIGLGVAMLGLTLAAVGTLTAHLLGPPTRPRRHAARRHPRRGDRRGQ